MESVPLLDRAGRRRSPATLSSFHQGLLAPQQGIALSTGSSDRGGDHRRDARGRRSRRPVQAARRDRCPMADRAANQRSARASGERSRPDTWRRAGAPWQGRQAPRGWDRPVGLRAARCVAPGPRRAAGRRSRVPAAPPAASLLPIRDSRLTPQRRPRGRGASSVRAAPAPPHPRGQDRAAKECR